MAPSKCVLDAQTEADTLRGVEIVRVADFETRHPWRTAYINCVAAEARGERIATGREERRVGAHGRSGSVKRATAGSSAAHALQTVPSAAPAPALHATSPSSAQRTRDTGER
jgi:hypothetical protein